MSEMFVILSLEIKILLNRFRDTTLFKIDLENAEFTHYISIRFA